MNKFQFSPKAQTVLAEYEATAETVRFVAEDGPLQKEIRSFLVWVTGGLKRDCGIYDWNYRVSADEYGHTYARLFPEAWRLPEVGPVAFGIYWKTPFAEDAEDLCVCLQLPWNWDHAGRLRNQLCSQMPDGFTNVYDGEPDASYPLWKYIRFQDFTIISGLDADAFYQAILSSFRSLLSLRPLIDEYISKCGSAPEPRTARRELGVVSVVDIETAGPEQELIELAVINAAYEKQSGELLGILGQGEGLREPKCRLSAAEQRLNGLGIDEVRGQVLNEERIRTLLRRADFVVAHNAPFDERTLTEQFKWAAELDWRDSLNGVDWGTESRDLQSLLATHGIDPGTPHRAGSDARALLELLSYRTSRGTYFAQLLKPKAEAAGAGA